MSKDSSIKVFAENVGDTNPRPVNNIPVWIENVSAIGGGGGGDFDPTYMSAQIDDKLNKSEVGIGKYYGVNYVSSISGVKLSAKNAYFAETANYAYTANYANGAQNAQTAYYDINGNYLTDTYYSVQNLSSFVQNNSANWGGGSGPTGDSGKVLFHKYYYYDTYGGTTDHNYVSGASELYFKCAVGTGVQPQEISILNNHQDEIARVYWTQTSSDEYTNYYSGSVNGLPTNVELELNHNGGAYVYCTFSANGNEISFPGYYDVRCQPSTNAKFNVQGYNITGRIDGFNQGSTTPLTSFTGNLNDFTVNGCDFYMMGVNVESYGNSWNYDLNAEFGGAGGSSVTSGDVLPPGPTGTGNTYVLAWNDYNGLFWDVR